MSESALEQAISMLADRLGIDPAVITVGRSVEVTWRDGSIGCAKSGFMYTQALVPGQLIELVVDGETYAFHQGGNQPPFYCASPTEAQPS